MSTDAPLGREASEEDWDEARVAAGLHSWLAAGRQVATAVARSTEAGRLVGDSVLTNTAADTVTAYQQDTLVLREHRGHRLGLALKVAALETLTSAVPGLRRVRTWNAESNAPMLRVNRQLGFVTTGIGVEWLTEL